MSIGVITLEDEPDVSTSVLLGEPPLTLGEGTEEELDEMRGLSKSSPGVHRQVVESSTQGCLEFVGSSLKGIGSLSRGLPKGYQEFTERLIDGQTMKIVC
ncbi:hypothetical protein B296_00029043 [Ensete ventricosum]|uniref:Uncharacterized protein n=1 Tax=Ensete ventricosum TaxID=4639 RepID=A0A426XY05_ENSVE|nr:hypothetical protein B296_00029043 [Ensete ventricosum]